MKVSRLIDKNNVVSIIGNEELYEHVVCDLCYNTQNAKKDVLYFAMKGKVVDGAKFIDKAYDNGARIFVSETIVTIPDDALLIVVNNSRSALSYASACFFNYPSTRLKVIGITGTKGKTTTTTLLYKVLNASGANAGVIGTNGIFYNDVHVQTANTTPESYDIHRVLNDMANAGITVCFIEVSSQGLMMSRVEHVQFFAGVFTNMAYDHIGDLEHPTFEDYLYWKTHLFDLATVAVVNADDEYVNHFIENKQLQVITYGIDKDASYHATQLQYEFNDKTAGMTFTLNKQDYVHLSVPGKFNVYNALVVLAIGELLQLTRHDIINQLKTASVSGRMELVPNHKGVLALLDFAHNGFALENVLTTIQHYDYNRLIIVFGSVGDRSQSRRKELGDVAAKYVDIAIITSDNPGFEDPMAIIEEISQSFEQSTCQVYKIADRKEAIQLAANLSEKGDIVLFAGKGHETYQLIGDEKTPFNEKELIKEAFE